MIIKKKLKKVWIAMINCNIVLKISVHGIRGWRTYIY